MNERYKQSFIQANGERAVDEFLTQKVCAWLVQKRAYKL